MGLWKNMSPLWTILVVLIRRLFGFDSSSLWLCFLTFLESRSSCRGIERGRLSKSSFSLRCRGCPLHTCVVFPAIRRNLLIAQLFILRFSYFRVAWIGQWGSADSKFRSRGRDESFRRCPIFCIWLLRIFFCSDVPPSPSPILICLLQDLACSHSPPFSFLVSLRVSPISDGYFLRQSFCWNRFVNLCWGSQKWSDWRSIARIGRGAKIEVKWKLWIPLLLANSRERARKRSCNRLSFEIIPYRLKRSIEEPHNLWLRRISESE